MVRAITAGSVAQQQPVSFNPRPVATNIAVVVLRVLLARCKLLAHLHIVVVFRGLHVVEFRILKPAAKSQL